MKSRMRSILKMRDESDLGGEVLVGAVSWFLI